MRVLAFCDSLSRAAAYQSAFAGGAHTLSFVICGGSPGSRLRFCASQLLRAALRAPAALPGVLAAWLGGRLLLTRAAIDSDAVKAFVRAARPDLGLHGLGVIYRRETIDACGLGILNAHIGELPRYRGRSVMEWSLLSGGRTGVTVFFIDEGIDTGSRIVLFEPVAVDGQPTLDAAKRHLFDQDARLYRRAVDAIAAGAAFETNDLLRGERFYEMSALFRDVLETSLPKGA